MALQLSAMQPDAQPLNLEQVMSDLGNYVHSLARRLTGSTADAEDVYQETFLRVFRFGKDFRGGSLKSWVRRITLNVVFSRTRAQSGAPVALDELVKQIPDGDPEPAAALDRQQLDEALEKALARLPLEFRSVILLREVDELNYAEIAEMLGIPLGTVRSRLARGRAMLRQTLEADPHHGL